MHAATFIRYSRHPGSSRLSFEEETISWPWIVVDIVSTPVVGSASEVKAVNNTKATAASKPANPPPDYSVITGLSKTKLPSIAERIAELDARMKQDKKECDELKQLGATLLLKSKVKSVMVGDIRVTQTGGCSKTIKRDLLLKYGVKEAVIEKATVTGEPWTSLKVTVRKAGEGEDEGEE